MHGGVPTSARKPSKDQELMNSIMNRIAKLDQANNELRAQIKTKSHRIESLESENFILTGDSTAESLR